MEIEGRTALFGTPSESSDTKTLVAYQAADGERTVWLPNAAIEGRIVMGTQTAYIIHDAAIDGVGQFKVAQVFAGDRNPMPPSTPQTIEVQDAVEQGVAVQNIRLMLKQDTDQQQEEEQQSPVLSLSLPEEQPQSPALSLSLDIDEGVTSTWLESSSDVDVLYDSSSDVDIDGDENDDTVPVFSPTDSQVTAKKVDPDAPDLSGTAWDGVLLAGGRHEASVPWRFTAEKYPLCAAKPTADGNYAMHKMTDKKGNQQFYAIVNPSLAKSEDDLGAILAPCVSNSYHILNHKDVFDPIIRHSDGTGLKALVTSYNDGKRARLDLDVSAAAQTRRAATEQLKTEGHGFINLDAFSAQANALHGLYKMGLTINNSIDGKGSLHIDLMSQRVYCANLAMMGASQNLVKMRHMSGVMGDINWDEWGHNMVSALVEVEKWMHTTELFKHIPVDTQLFEQLLTVADNFNLIQAPKVTWPEKNKDPKISGGYLWRAISNGYAHADADYVKVHKEDENTLFHALNAFTGTYTHRPIWKSMDNKTTLVGHTGSLDTLSNRLKTTTNVFNKIGESAISGYMNSAGIDAGELTPGDLQDMKRFLGEDEGIMEIKIGGNPIAAMPTYSEVLGLTVLDDMGGPNGI